MNAIFMYSFRSTTTTSVIYYYYTPFVCVGIMNEKLNVFDFALCFFDARSPKFEVGTVAINARGNRHIHLYMIPTSPRVIIGAKKCHHVLIPCFPYTHTHTQQVINIC